MSDTLVTLSETGVLLARNSDRDVNEAQVLRWYDAAEHPAGTLLDCTWSRIDQASRTHAVLLSQPWWTWGAEMGANEHGVVIGHEPVFTRGTGPTDAPAPEGTALLGMDLVRLGLERAADRHQAVEVIVGLLEAHGQGGSTSHEDPSAGHHSSYLVADPRGAVVLETAGRHWATEEVTGGGRSISNGLTIPGFADTYADPLRGRVAGCAARRARTTRSAREAAGPGDLFVALRDHGRDYGDNAVPAYTPRYRRLNGALSAPCAHAGGLLTGIQTTAAWVSDLRPGTPPGGRHWVTGTAATCTSTFKPVTVGERVDHEPDAPPTNRYDSRYLWWRHEPLHRLAMHDPERAAGLLADERDRLEARWLEEPPPGSTAFEEANRLEDIFSGRLRAASLRDVRPGWVRRRWRRWDQEAGL